MKRSLSIFSVLLAASLLMKTLVPVWVIQTGIGINDHGILKRIIL